MIKHPDCVLRCQNAEWVGTPESGCYEVCLLASKADPQQVADLILCDRCSAVVLIDAFHEGFEPLEIKTKMASHYREHHPGLEPANA